MAALLTAMVPEAASAARLTVCAFSFNTPHEVQAFRSGLPEEDFEVVDLSPHLSPPPDVAAGGADAWLPRVCGPDLQCDVAVYSAEFAGRFFGSYGRSLTLQQMEEESCQPRCDGLFHHPREVFLLACNTLATKDEDRRTPEQYLRVLLDHGFERATAERVVASRYGPLGPSFHEAIRRVFMGVPRIYGFSSVAPAGDETAALLEKYFRAKGDYVKYMERMQDDVAPNKELLVAFRGTGLVQTTGLMRSEATAADRADMCQLYDERESVADRLRIVRRLFDRSDFLTFLPTIEVFVDRHPLEDLKGEERRIAEEIQAHETARSEVVRLVHELEVSALKMELAHFARHLDWVGAAEFRRLALDGARQLLARPLTSEVVDVMCEIAKHEVIENEFRSADLPQRLFEDAEGIRFVDCLSPIGEAVSARLVPALDSGDVATQLWAGYALSRRLPLEDAILMRVAEHVDDPSADMRERVRWVLRNEAPVSAAVRRVVEARDPALGVELRTAHGRRLS